MKLHEWMKSDRLPDSLRMILAMEVIGKCQDEDGEILDLSPETSDMARKCFNILTTKEYNEDEKSVMVNHIFSNFSKGQQWEI